MSTENGTTDAPAGTPPREGKGGGHKASEGGITSILNSVKRKISQTLSPDSTGKTKNVGDNVTKITSPEYKKAREGNKSRKKKKKKRGEKTQISQERAPPKLGTQTPDDRNTGEQIERDASIASTSTCTDLSQSYDTEDDLPLADLSQKVNKDRCEQRKRPITRSTRGRLNRIRRLLHRRQTPLKTRPTDPQEKTINPLNDPDLNPNGSKPEMSTDIGAAINSIRDDIKSIKLDGNRLGEVVLKMQREIGNVRKEMVTKELLDASLTKMVTSVNAQLDLQKGEIDHNRENILEIQEELDVAKANIETQFATQEDHESRIESMEETVVRDLSSFRKELQGFEDRFSKAFPPTPFLPSEQNKSNAVPPSHPNIDPGIKSTQLAEQQENKNIIIEGLSENPVEDLEGKVCEMMQEIGITLVESEYNKMERMGKWSAQRNWPRPIKVELMTTHKKSKILVSREYLIQTNDYFRVRINPEEPKETRVARALLRQTANKARREGKQVKQTPDTVMVNGVKYDLKTIHAIGRALDHGKPEGGHPAEGAKENYPAYNKYAEDTCMLDTPRGLAFFTIRCMLSNFYPCTIRFNGRRYESAEHAYQAEKAIAARAFDKLNDILSAPTAARAKEIGRDIPDTPLWQRIKVDRMRNILNAKFRQNKILGGFLCSLRGTGFIEANQTNFFWGAGVSLQSNEIRTGRWNGRNELGKLLTELRDDLLRERRVKDMAEKVGVPPPIPKNAHHRETTARAHRYNNSQQGTSYHNYKSI